MSLRNEIAKIVKAGLDDYFCEVVANEYDVTDQILALIEGELAEIKEKAQKWDKVKEIASSDYCSRCFNRFKCPSADYAPCPFKDILEEVEGEKDDRA